ncbi:MAG: hypothetical protein P9M13_08415 [Candidatus Ancaeobacter aquaticus]|nr:hypothetical protein [Candidatus Ancaeobacter aquaticus]
MARLSDKEKNDFRNIAFSKTFREDAAYVKKNRHNPFISNGEVNTDKVIEFLDEYNAFVNHTPKLFKKINDQNMRL